LSDWAARPVFKEPQLDERAGIERGWTLFDQSAIYEVADFDGNHRPLSGISDNADADSLLFAPIIVNELRPALDIMTILLYDGFRGSEALLVNGDREL
jgi:hypothetical protein